MRRLDETLCGHERKYSTGDVLFSDPGKRIVLGKLIAEGGEGSSSCGHRQLPCSDVLSSNATDAMVRIEASADASPAHSLPVHGAAAREPVRRTAVFCRF